MTDHSLPLVSIGIPTFNRASSLVTAIESVLKQTYPNIQLLISDNASIDETQSICENFCKNDVRVTYIRQKSNLGATNNFKEVLKHSNGEFFMWLGDDDWIDDNYIAKCIKILAENPDYSLVCGICNYYIKEKFIEQGQIINLEQEDKSDRVLSYYQQVSDNGTFYGLMRTNQISNIPIKNVMGGDWLMIATISFLGKVKTLSNTFVNRQVRENDSPEQMAERMELSKFYGRNLMFSILISASKDIINNSNYDSLNFEKKISLLTNIFVLFGERYRLYSWNNLFFSCIKEILSEQSYFYIRDIHRSIFKSKGRHI